MHLGSGGGPRSVSHAFRAKHIGEGASITLRGRCPGGGVSNHQTCAERTGGVGLRYGENVLRRGGKAAQRIRILRA